MFSKILLPVDRGMDSNEYAAEEAVELATAHDSTIYVVHVVRSENKDWEPDGPDPEPITHMREFFDGQEAVEDVQYMDIEGSPVSMICHLVGKLDCDVIVMPTHARKGLSRVIIGSITEDVIRKAPCPVLTMSPRLNQQ